MNYKRIKRLVELSLSPSSIPKAIGITASSSPKLWKVDKARQATVELSRQMADTDGLIGPSLRRMSEDIAAKISSELAEDERFSLAIETINSSLRDWVYSLLVDGDLFIHVLEDEETGQVGCGVSINREPYFYERNSTEFDEAENFSYYQDGRYYRIDEPIVHARINKSGRYGRPLFSSALGHAKSLSTAETHELKRRVLSSVLTRYHMMNEYTTQQQAEEFLKSISVSEVDDVFRDVVTRFPVNSIQGDGNVDKIGFLTYLLGRIDPSSPVPLPLLSFSAAASVNRDTMQQMAREYRLNLVKWREIISQQIVRPILYAVADILGVDATEAIEATTVSSAPSMSPQEIQTVVMTAQVMQASGIIPLAYIADYLAKELGIAQDDTKRRLQQSVDSIGDMQV